MRSIVFTGFEDNVGLSNGHGPSPEVLPGVRIEQIISPEVIREWQDLQSITQPIAQQFIYPSQFRDTTPGKPLRIKVTAIDTFAGPEDKGIPCYFYPALDTARNVNEQGFGILLPDAPPTRSFKQGYFIGSAVSERVPSPKLGKIAEEFTGISLGIATLLASLQQKPELPPVAKEALLAEVVRKREKLETLLGQKHAEQRRESKSPFQLVSKVKILTAASASIEEIDKVAEVMRAWPTGHYPVEKRTGPASTGDRIGLAAWNRSFGLIRLE